jgi:hypothetical protein
VARTDDVLRSKLLELHRELVEVDRLMYERVHGRITPADLLDNLLHHPAFVWLRPLSALIAEADATRDPETAEADARAWRNAVRTLLTADPDGAEFQRRYAERLQQSPGVVMAHAAVIEALGR